MTERLPCRLFFLAALAVLPALAGGCASVAAGAGAQALVYAAQERPAAKAVDDKAIQLKLNARFIEADPNLFARVESEVVEGRVLLTGNVPRPEDRVEAARLAWQVEGVREILNEIVVNDRSGVIDYFKDSWITTRLRSRIAVDPEVFDINYSIETVNGVIYVMGIAQNQKELDRLIGHAREIPGVRRVISHVHMKDDPRRAGT